MRAKKGTDFWERVNRSGNVVRPDLGPCWEWTGPQDRDGYGRSGKVAAHRVSFFLMHGRWPTPMGLHHCDNPICVKSINDERGPSHIYEGESKRNSKDAIDRGRVAHGSRGGSSKLDEETVYRIRNRYASGETQTSIAEEFGVSQTMISIIVTGKCWSRVGGPKKISGKCGELNRLSKLTDDQVLSIRKEYATGQFTQSELGRKYGVVVQNINNIVSNKTWKHILPNDKNV